MRQHINNHARRYLIFLSCVCISVMYLVWLKTKIGDVTTTHIDEELLSATPAPSKENKSILDRIFPIVEQPLPDAVSQETILELQSQIPPRECFKEVQKVGDRCGYYVVLGETASIGVDELWDTLMQNPIVKGHQRNEYRCNYDTPYPTCISRLGEQAIVHPEEAHILIGKGPSRPLSEELVASMFKAAPELKIVLLFQHPVNRLYSYWHHEVRKESKRKNQSYQIFHDWLEEQTNRTQSCFDPVSESFSNCFSDPKKFDPLAMSSYVDIIRVYESFYPSSQLYVMISEEFLENPQRETDKLMKWLELPTQKYFFPNTTDVQQYDPLDLRTREDVWSIYYEKGVRRLEEYLGRDLPWTMS